VSKVGLFVNYGCLKSPDFTTGHAFIGGDDVAAKPVFDLAQQGGAQRIP
jgi:hypothetical protein